LLLGVATSAGITLATPGARASQEFPGAIQEAAGMPCAPSCTLCHGVNPGTASTFNSKAIGKSLFMIDGILPPHDTVKFKSSYAKWAAANPTLVVKLQQGIDPETGEGLCGPTYGCGATIAKQSQAVQSVSTDVTGALWVLGALGIAAGRLRRKRS
jgi:hypothetical protein